MARSDLPVCWPCGTEMRCEKNSVVVDAGHGRVKEGDRYRCPTCGHLVVVGLGDPYRAEPDLD